MFLFFLKVNTVIYGVCVYFCNQGVSLNRPVLWTNLFANFRIEQKNIRMIYFGRKYRSIGRYFKTK